MRVPKLCRQREKFILDRAYVMLNGKRIQCGDWGKPEAKENYDRLIAEWLENHRQLPAQPQVGINVDEIVARFALYSEEYYRKPDGTMTSEVCNLRQAVRPLLALYGSTPANEFGPLKLKALRQNMIGLGWARTNINRNVGRIKLVFRWAVANEHVPSSVYEALKAVPALKRGRSEARETDKVKPVPQDLIDGIRGRVSRQVEALIDLQLRTGARPGELLKLRPIDIDTSGTYVAKLRKEEKLPPLDANAPKVWICRPEHHKTLHRGKDRTIFFGPHAQEVLNKFLAGRATDAYLFSPREAEQERHAKAETHRREDQKPNACKSSREVGECYTRHSYRIAIARACDKAFPHPVLSPVPRQNRTPEQQEELQQWRREHRWHPHQLRHNAATYLRREFGVDIAQTVLGHALGSGVTEIYAEKNMAAAVDAIMKVG